MCFFPILDIMAKCSVLVAVPLVLVSVTLPILEAQVAPSNSRKFDVGLYEKISTMQMQSEQRRDELR